MKNLYFIDIQGEKLSENRSFNFFIPQEHSGEEIFLTNGTYKFNFKMRMWNNRTILLGNFFFNIEENGVKNVIINLPIYHITVKPEYFSGKNAPISRIILEVPDRITYYAWLFPFIKIENFFSFLNECFIPLPPGSYALKIYSFDSFRNEIYCLAKFKVNNSDTIIKAKFYAITLSQTAFSLPLFTFLCITTGYLLYGSIYLVHKHFEKIRKLKIRRRPLIFSIIFSTTSILAPWQTTIHQASNSQWSFYFPILLEIEEIIPLNFTFWRFEQLFNLLAFLFTLLTFWIPLLILLYQTFKLELQSSTNQIIGASIIMLIAPILCTAIVLNIRDLIRDITVVLGWGCYFQLLSAIFGFIDVIYIKRVKLTFVKTIKLFNEYETKNNLELAESYFKNAVRCWR